MSEDLSQVLEEYGALPSQVVSLTREDPTTLRFADLLRAPVEGGQPVVVCSEGRARAYIFDDRQGRATEQTVKGWIRRISFRGDADYVGVLRVGRLDVYLATLSREDGPPRAVEGLPEGRLRLAGLLHAPPAGQTEPVRKVLRNLLLDSIGNVRRLGVEDPDDALSLVGRALFWRFLIDRRLLDGLDPRETWGVARPPEQCFDRRASALKVFDWLDTTFNGGLLTFNGVPAGFPDAVYEEVLGNIAHGATSSGQLRLPSDWNEVNFAHVPVGLLSEIYEAFAHDSNPEQADRESIHFTPRHIAEFVVDEALAALEDVERPKVLDPAVGAGVFLVATFRALVAREWKRTGVKPSRTVVRRILNEQLVGFDINGQALRLAELALYLTAIELDPAKKPRPMSVLRFDPPLRPSGGGKGVLHLQEGGHEQGSLAPVRAPFLEQFDLVVGNPPWTAPEKPKGEAGAVEQAQPGKKKRWEDDTRELVKTRLGERRAKAFAFADTTPDVPFVFRAMEWAKPGGQIALVTHANWLFLQSTHRRRARQDLLESVQVTGVLHGTDLREAALWPGVRAPFCLLFARNQKPELDDALQFVTIRSVRAEPRQEASLRFDWTDASDVSIRQAVEKPWALKARFRGTSFDEELLRRLLDTRPTLESVLTSLMPTTRFQNGYKVGNKAQDAVELLKLKDVRGAVTFRLDEGKLKRLSEPKLERPRERDTYRAPLLLVREVPPAGPDVPRSTISEKDVVFSGSWYGASFARIPEGLEHARQLQLLVQSKLFLWFQLLTDGRFGFERDRFEMQNLQEFPVVPWNRMSARQRRVALQLSERLWEEGLSPELSEQLDDYVFNVYGLDDVDRDVVRDTCATALPWAEQRKNAHRAVCPEEIDQFVSCLKESLDDVWTALGHEALVRRRLDTSQGPWEVLQVDRVREGGREQPQREVPWERLLEAADDSGASLVTVRTDPRTTLVGLLRPYRLWTRTRARLLASNLLSGAGI